MVGEDKPDRGQALSPLATPYRHHIRLRVDDALNKRSKGFEASALLFKIFMAIVNAPNPADDVTQTSFCMVGGTPARDIRLLAVRRRSWIVQLVTPLAWSIAAL